MQYALVTAIHQGELAIDILIFNPSKISLPPPTPLGGKSPGLSSLSHRAKSHCLCFLYNVEYRFPYYSLDLSHPLLSPLCPAVCFSVSVSLFLPCK